jgi:hypothetical protein
MQQEDWAAEPVNAQPAAVIPTAAVAAANSFETMT